MSNEASAQSGISRILIVEYWFPLLLWLIIIYLFSTDNFSADRTSGLIVPLLRFLFPSASLDQIYFLHAVIRKLGHITEYFVLTVLTYRALNFHAADSLKAKLFSFEFALLVALADEFHQSLTMYRGASIVDVGYDSLGGLVAMSMATMLRK